MARSGVDFVSVDWTVDMKEADRLGANIGVQGNLELVTKSLSARASSTPFAKANRGIYHLGHGVLPSTPEENVAFFETAKQPSPVLVLVVFL